MVLSESERFWAKVEKTDNHWFWRGAHQPLGYGLFGIGSRSKGTFRNVGAHRYAYEALVGPIPAGLELDHLCRTPACVNPAHLEPVTRRVNQIRSKSVSGTNFRKTHCLNGHPFDLENTYWIKGKRACKECQRQRVQAYRARLKERAS